MKARPPGLSRAIARGRRAWSEQTAKPGSEPIDIRTLIAPLRYDVIVRAHFFDFLAAHAGLAPAALVQAASESDYGVWFTQIECARFFPELLHDEEMRQRRFADRVLGAARLLQSFEANGFDRSKPVTLLKAQAGLLSDSGAPALGDLHVGDGCHRLALVLRSQPTLEPWMYRWRPTAGVLVDNTAVLIRALGLAEHEYVRFLAPHFPLGDAGTVLAAMEHVRAHDSAASGLLESVVVGQWPRIENGAVPGRSFSAKAEVRVPSAAPPYDDDPLRKG